jgi:diacylglycerol O-acyltransferase / wax synthase
VIEVKSERVDDPRAPVAPRATVKVERSRILVEVAWLLFLVFIYGWLQDLAPLRGRLAFIHAQAILAFERSVGLAPERALDHWLARQDVLAFIVSSFYSNAIFLVTFTFAAWIWWRRPDIYRPLRNDLVVANLIGFTVFWAYPVAPPRMLPGFVDVVAKSGGLGSWHDSLIRHADQLAAMPSMHVGYAVWCSLAAWRLARGRSARMRAAVFGTVYPLLTALVVMATGNHYLLDVVAGAATVLVAVLIVEVTPRILHRTLPATAAFFVDVPWSPPRTKD